MHYSETTHSLRGTAGIVADWKCEVQPSAERKSRIPECWRDNVCGQIKRQISQTEFEPQKRSQDYVAAASTRSRSHRVALLKLACPVHRAHPLTATARTGCALRNFVWWSSWRRWPAIRPWMPQCSRVRSLVTFASQGTGQGTTRTNHAFRQCLINVTDKINEVTRVVVRPNRTRVVVRPNRKHSERTGRWRRDSTNQL